MPATKNQVTESFVKKDHDYHHTSAYLSIPVEPCPEPSLDDLLHRSPSRFSPRRPLLLLLLSLPLLVMVALGVTSSNRPSRSAEAARDQEPEDAHDFEKREVENCVPFGIRSFILDSHAVVEWSTRRTYIPKVNLQKANDKSPALENPWRSCHEVATGVEVRYRRLGENDTMLVTGEIKAPFVRKVATTYTTDEATFNTHSARIDLPEREQDAAYEFTVGSIFHGWSAVHRLGANVPYRGDEAELCRPKHVHTAYGHTPGSLSVQWMTKAFCGEGDAQLTLMKGYHAHIEVEGPKAMPVTAWANTTLFEDDGEAQSKRWMHVVRLEGLQPDSRYTYVVGNAAYSSWSIPYVTKTAPAPLLPGEKPKPTRFLVTGDIGYQNAATLPMMQSEVAEGVVDGVVSVGDYAYDLDMMDGHVGDIFMQQIEPFAASVPFMVCPGNHEQHNTFSHYSERFRLMPSNENEGVQTVHIGGHSKEAEPQEVPNNWFYSFDVGLVHFTVISTEIYFKKTFDVDGDVIARQEAWLEQDLAKANANRQQTPWLVVIGHRPMYCTSDSTNCGDKAAMLRDRLEDKLFKHGVDVYLCGHQHNYERAFDVYRSQTWKRTRNMRATTHILTGASGQYLTTIMRKAFERPAESWDAFRNNIFGYSRMEVANATHLHWQQVEADPENPAARGHYGEVIDDVWLVQERHGSFEPLDAAS
ncbi:Serine/threonine-protein phosphatase cpped1 [Phytophthora pseudosyringae]|uniref:Serine/threonine-protein phosphatase cpped1 n=1 Tax=Phytophthora pseudosyringae TaxID=221518 RepID=A0A8T1WG99_9STRA|nr:Serine/threonine-protein phosphatase cpped1 [Phytophthora pseudosyringae]